MHLQTLSYDPEPSSDVADPMIGLPDLRKGLNLILLGYLLSIGTLLSAAAVIAYVVMGLGRSPSAKAVEGVSTTLFAVVAVGGLAMLWCMALLVRGKWLCLLCAPEHYHAKWLMFLSILFVLTSPALNVISPFLGDDAKKETRASASKRTTNVLLREIEESSQFPSSFGTRAYVRMAGSGAGVLSGVFFVLFLRALGLCSGLQLQARMAECYLLFVGLLIAGAVVVLGKPAVLRMQPLLLPILGLGWLVSGLWYFGLIIGASLSISRILAIQPKSLT